jgi:sulfatase maturation enzyme AslB (radical SAM superfamily)
MIAISPAITAMQGKSATKNMTSDTAFKIVDFALAQSNNGHPVQINFFGGEPFLCLDLMREVADYTLKN